jgi:hypothetical protein
LVVEGAAATDRGGDALNAANNPRTPSVILNLQIQARLDARAREPLESK